MISVDQFIYRIYENPLLRDVRKSDIVEHIKTVLRLLNVPATMVDKRVVVNVQNYRAVLPADAYQVKSVMAMDVGGRMKVLTAGMDRRMKFQGELRDTQTSSVTYQFVPGYIYADFESGDIEVIYRGYQVDSNGSPMIPDEISLLLAMENYIKVRQFTIGVELGTINQNALRAAEQQYHWYMGQAANKFTLPTMEEAESLYNSIATLIPRREEHSTNYKYTGLGEVLRRHP